MSNPKNNPEMVHPMSKVVSDEPEDSVGSAMYLLQLIQQDLNMGRNMTIWARAKRAREHCEAIERMFSPNVPSDLSLLAFGIPPAREAESAGGMPKVPKA